MLRLILAFACLVIAHAQAPCQPYSEGQIVRMLTGSVVPSRVQKLVSDCGVDFEMTPQSEARLRKAGATDGVVEAVRRKGEAAAVAKQEAEARAEAERAAEARREAERVAAARREAEERAAIAQREALLLRLGGTVMEFVRIPAGEFQMGCPPGDGECSDDEKPAHRVRITRGFELGKYEVTQAQWEAVMGTNPSQFKGSERPVEMVGWDNVQVFLSRLNQKNDGHRYRLPTEAEWEYAARAGSLEQHTGPVDGVAWFRNSSGMQTHPVGQKQANGWGLYDMQGNVWEWCGDWYDFNYYGSSPAENPPGPASGQFRVLRGGSWGDSARFLRVSGRDRDASGDRGSDIGLRCVREAR